MERRELPAGWDKEIPSFPADAKGHGHPRSRAARCSTPWPRTFPGCSAVRPTSPRRRRRCIDGASGFSSRQTTAAATSTSASASTAWPRPSTAWPLRPAAYGATFFVFSDYLRPSMRLAAIMNLPSIFVFTHDSIGVGEDGPTHQPVEHLAAARAIPDLVVIRPGDANEVGRTPGRRPSRKVTGRRRSCSLGRTCRRSTARSTRAAEGVAAAATCWSTPRAASRT